MQRIGVFVCWCGSNIAATVDVARVVETIRREPGVVYAADYQYMCSEAGQAIIRGAIAEHKLTGIVVCSCSPRMHEATFRKTAQRAGLNPFMVEIANIREQCSWIHKDKEEATEKAIVLARAAVAKVSLNAPLISGESSVTKRALVIGGGIAGIQSALDIAEAGYEVDIVEKEPTIGGKMSKLDKTFPTLDCSACILTPKMVDAAANEKITLYTYSEIEQVKGFVGNFKVKIRRKARYVKEDVCTGCGQCMQKCPSKKGLNEFNLGLNKRTAIYIPFAQAIPNVAVIDPTQCIKLKSGKCGLCSTVCAAKAIDYEQQDEFIEREYGAIVMATGFNPIKLDKFDEYSYSSCPDVITSLELERIMNAAGPTGGKLVKITSPLAAMKHGISYLPEDRKRDGIIGDLSVRDNIILARQVLDGFFHPISKAKAEKYAEEYIRLLSIKTASTDTPIKSLSGGNQQKVILARWLLANPVYMILDEPTRGIDVGTKAEIYKIMEELAASGVGIIMISTELPETLGISDRVLVMRKGRIVAELDPKKTSEEEIVSYSAMEGIPNEK